MVTALEITQFCYTWTDEVLANINQADKSEKLMFPPSNKFFYKDLDIMLIQSLSSALLSKQFQMRTQEKRRVPQGFSVRRVGLGRTVMT